LEPIPIAARRRPTGMLAFVVVWLGQVISILASTMSHFGLSIWMYQQTESATAMGLMQVFFITPFLLMSPIAGVWVDRYNRKLMMMVSDLTAVVATGGVLLLYATGQLEFWHLYIAAVLNGVGNTFQWPAYSAAITTMVPKEQYGRANGLMSLMEAGPGVLSPLLAGALLPLVGLVGLLALDVVTFFAAIGALLMVDVPQPARTAEGQKGQGNMWREAAYGFQYILQRPSLLGLQLLFFFGNLFTGIGRSVLAPMVLARTASDSVVFAMVQSAGALGAVAGGIVMSAWGGFKRRVHGVFLGWAAATVGLVFLGMGQGVSFWLPAAFVGAMAAPLANTSNQALWQAKVAPDVQGRVFSARRLIAWFAGPVSPIIGGTLADYVLEPAMRSQGGLAALFGWLVGTGPGAGMGLLMVISGLVASLVAVGGYFVPAIRNVETLLPDHDCPASVAV